MAPTIFFLVLSLLFIPTSTHLQSNEEGFISVLISNKGIDFVKDVLIDKAVSSIIPLQLPQIEKSVKIPVVGKVHAVLSNITIYYVDVAYSTVRTGETGVVLVASDATAKLSMNWRYSYKKWLIKISDHGSASVQVEGMEVGLNLGLKNQEGTLKLSLLNCGCHVKDISIELDGGASWLYQLVVDAFEGKIGSAVENAISKKIREGITKLDSLLKSLPKEIKVDQIAALNLTFVNDPVLSNSYIDFEINGLFTATDEVMVSKYYHERSQASTSCKGLPKMVEISLHEKIFNSVSFVYYNADHMHWIVDKTPDQSILNTAGWIYIIPELYKQYPNDDMILNISASAPPIIKIGLDDIDATIYLDVIIDVLDTDEVIPVACISMVIRASCSPEILSNNLAGSVRLNNFDTYLNWSNIGSLDMHLVKSLLSTVLETVFLPYVNLHLGRGFPLPMIHGFTLQNAGILLADSRIVICSDVAPTEKQLPVYYS